MKKYIFGAVFTAGIFLSPMVSQASGLTASQIQSILNLLSAFNADPSVITNVQISLTGNAIPTPTTSTGVSNGSLSISLGQGDPVAANVIAGASQTLVGQFNFAAQNSSYTIQNLAILIPTNSALNAVTNVMISYKDINGVTHTATQSLVVNTSNTYATSTFTGLTMYVPVNGSTNLNVYVGIPAIAFASANISGTAIKVLLDTGGNAGGNHTFRALNGSSVSTTYVGGSPLPSNGVLYVRKSIPTFATIGVPVSTGTGLPATGSPLYKFTVVADPSGAIEWTKVTFNVAASGASLSNVYLTDNTDMNLLDTGAAVAVSSNIITIDLTKNSSLPKYQQIAPSASKTYSLYGTVSGWTNGSSLSINLAPDVSAVANGSATTVSGNTVWSDRAATGHTTSTADWVNGYLVKDFTGSVAYATPTTSCASNYGATCTFVMSNTCGQQTSVSGTVSCTGTCNTTTPSIAGCVSTTTPVAASALSVMSVVGQQVTVSYSNLPVHSYINLLWRNQNGVFEATGQGQLSNGGSGSIVIMQDPNVPSGYYKAEARTTDSMNVVADSSMYVYRSATAALNCSLSAYPSTVMSGQSTTLTWGSLGANNASWTQNGDANLLGLPSTIFLPDGSQAFTVSGKSGTLSPVLNVYRTDGLSGTCSTNITVNQPIPTPTCSLTSSAVSNGQYSLSWTVPPNTTSAQLTPIPGMGSGSLNALNQSSIQTNASGTYTLTCTGSGGSTTSSVTIAAPTCSVVDVYATQVPGFAYYNVYMKVNNLPSSGDILPVGNVTITGADSWSSLVFNLDGAYSTSGTVVLKATQTVNATGVSYILARKNTIIPTANGTKAITCSTIGTVAQGPSANQSQLASVASAFGAAASAATKPQNAFSYVWNRDLQIGSPYFADVSALQSALTHEGLYSGEITGGFYNETFAAVKAFQLTYNIDATGFVGPTTRAKLNALYGN